MTILEQIKSPADLKGMSDAQLAVLSDEIREYIIKTVSKTGGHLASNLGAVELTVALHACFDCPHDKIVFDVGHQCYTHKILTGRMEAMRRLRMRGGPSGFPVITESEYDAFGAGHAGVSVSAALGLARARDLRGGDEHVVAVVGDGALGNGMIYEGINDAGNTGNDLIVVLNDNTMSIAPNVGAVARALTHMRESRRYALLKKWTRSRFTSMPRLENLVHRMKNGIKYMVVPGALFEEMGMFYIGPVDGHDIRELKNALERAKKIKGPVLVHVMTKKGHGYTAAERDPRRYHSAGSFAVSSGKMQIKPLRRKPFPAEVSDALLQLAKEDERIAAVTAAMPDATGLSAFAAKYPSRFFDVGIAEEHAVTMAAGLARGGMRPVVPIYSTFLQRAYDSIIHDVCTQNLPVILLADHAGIVGDDGQTHQGVFDTAYLRSIPNMTLLSPCEPREMAAAIRYALILDAPCAIRYPKGDNGLLLGNSPIEPFPKWRKLTDGNDVAIVAEGVMARQAMGAAKLLKENGVGARVFAARSVKPMDEESLQSALECRYVVTLEDGVLQGGFGSAVLEWMNERGVNRPLLRLGVPDRFLAHETRAQWLEELRLDPCGVTSRVLAFMEGRH